VIRYRSGRKLHSSRLLTRGQRRLAAVAATLVAIGVTSLVAERIDPSLELKLTQTVQGLGDLIPKAKASTLTGKASVIDGDTIEIRGQHIRFDGIDAPESAQLCIDGKKQAYKCGQDAAFFLERFIAVASPVRCEFVEWDQYDRFVGECFRADGVSLNAGVVGAGYAMDWPQHSNGKYAAYQRDAKAEKVGMWDGAFTPTWEFRAKRRANQAKVNSQDSPALFAIEQPGKEPSSGSGCSIKGNISIDSGQHIYHVPGQKFYSKTKISPEHGERWFCSEAEARAEGWRRSKQ
jgi:endonuclease YncB( thermonuclease family)